MAFIFSRISVDRVFPVFATRIFSNVSGDNGP